jgi:hypothetical protein
MGETSPGIDTRRAPAVMALSVEISAVGRSEANRENAAENARAAE